MAEDFLAVHCRKCFAVITKSTGMHQEHQEEKEAILCFFQHLNKKTHLCVRPSQTKSFLDMQDAKNTTNTKTIMFKTNLMSQKRSFNPRHMQCLKCKELVGNEYAFGPSKELMLAFSFEGVALSVSSEDGIAGKTPTNYTSWNAAQEALQSSRVKLVSLSIATFDKDFCESFKAAIKNPDVNNQEDAKDLTDSDLEPDADLQSKKSTPQGEKEKNEAKPTFLTIANRFPKSHEELWSVIEEDGTLSATSPLPRTYQLECVMHVLLRDTILYIPTGGGKTLVAVLTARILKAFNPDKHVIFLADRVPLVFQQGQFFKKACPTWNILIMCGQQQQQPSDSKTNNVLGGTGGFGDEGLGLAAYDMLACTPQILINLIEAKRLALGSACLLVIDEVHAATGNHPYAILLTRYLQNIGAEDKPRILGLTASPANTGSFVGSNPNPNTKGNFSAAGTAVEATIAPNMVAAIDLSLDTLLRKIPDGAYFTPVLYRHDLIAALNRPQVNFEEVPEDDPFTKSLLDLIKELCVTLGIRFLWNQLVSTSFSAEDKSIAAMNLQPTRHLIRTLHQAALDGQNRTAQHRVDFLEKAWSAHEMASVLGPQTAALYLRSLVLDCTKDIGGWHWNARDRAYLVKFLQALSPYTVKACSSDASDKKGHVHHLDTLRHYSDESSPKVRQLLKVLRADMEQERSKDSSNREEDTGSRILIFVETRRTARWLVNFLGDQEDIANALHPLHLVGQSGDSLEGMSWEEDQEPTLQAFRSGQTKCLVCTSVLREGLDVPVCNRVICFDVTWSLTAFIQARGRARHILSHFTVLCSPSQRMRYEQMVRGEAIQEHFVLRRVLRALPPSSNRQPTNRAATHVNLAGTGSSESTTSPKLITVPGMACGKVISWDACWASFAWLSCLFRMVFCVRQKSLMIRTSADEGDGDLIASLSKLTLNKEQHGANRPLLEDSRLLFSSSVMVVAAMAFFVSPPSSSLTKQTELEKGLEWETGEGHPSSLMRHFRWHRQLSINLKAFLGPSSSYSSADAAFLGLLSRLKDSLKAVKKKASNSNQREQPFLLQLPLIPTPSHVQQVLFLDAKDVRWGCLADALIFKGIKNLWQDENSWMPYFQQGCLKNSPIRVVLDPFRGLLRILFFLPKVNDDKKEWRVYRLDWKLNNSGGSGADASTDLDQGCGLVLDRKRPPTPQAIPSLFLYLALRRPGRAYVLAEGPAWTFDTQEKAFHGIHEYLNFTASSIDTRSWERVCTKSANHAPGDQRPFNIDLVDDDCSVFLPFPSAMTVRLHFAGLKAAQEATLVRCLQRLRGAPPVLVGHVSLVKQSSSMLGIESFSSSSIIDLTWAEMFALKAAHDACPEVCSERLDGAFVRDCLVPTIHRFRSASKTTSNRSKNVFLERSWPEALLEASRFEPLANVLERAISDALLASDNDLDEKKDAKGEGMRTVVEIASLTLTPSRIVLGCWKAMQMNRVLRHFALEKGVPVDQYFLRVYVRDEDGVSKVSSSAAGGTAAGSVSPQVLQLRLKALLSAGCRVFGRPFDLLAMSSSQLRDHGCWFVAPFATTTTTATLSMATAGIIVEWNADKIRTWLGDFSQIKSVAKYVARMGQSLAASQATICVNDRKRALIHSSPRNCSKKSTAPGECEEKESLDLDDQEQGFVEVTEVDDVERNGYCFTDGIGMISPALARKVASRLRSCVVGDKLFEQDYAEDYQSDHSCQTVPTAVQFRYAGYKGVVAVNPMLSWDDPRLCLWLRPSQRKFSSAHRLLEVLNVAVEIPCFLNRQVIMILSGLGVPDSTFLSLQDAHLRGLAKMLVDPVVALDHLRSNYAGYPALPTILSASSSSSNTALSVNMAYEPYFRSLLLSIYRKELKDLLTRSRIHVPQGRILMGVIDELGVLGPEEIFVQISQSDKNKTTGVYFKGASEVGMIESARGWTVTSVCVVAKNPCMHPGDVRRLQAVYHLHLAQYYSDVLVFPKHPALARPITDQCSGSDLDGDLYFCSWDPLLIPPRLHEPMDYSCAPAPPVKKEQQQKHDEPRQETNSATPRKDSHQGVSEEVCLDDFGRVVAVQGSGGEEEAVSMEDVVQFTVGFIANDQLGAIANAHAAHVDLSPLGVADPVCMLLAKVFALAVDFPKTGFVAVLPASVRVTEWPDFMGKSDKPTYASHKVIGQLYRKVASLSLNTIHSPRVESITAEPAFMEHPGRKHFQTMAHSLYNSYTQQARKILKMYGIAFEAQLLSSSVDPSSAPPFFNSSSTSTAVEFSAVKTHTPGKDDAKDAQALAGHFYRRLQRHMRHEFDKVAAEEHYSSSLDKLSSREEKKKALACAWYAAAYSPPPPTNDALNGFLSFAWIVGDVLMDVLHAAQRPASFKTDQSSNVLFMRIGKDAEDMFSRVIARCDLHASLVSRLAAVEELKALIVGRVDGVRSVSLTGSTTALLFTPQSDVNVVVELENIVSDETDNGQEHANASNNRILREVLKCVKEKYSRAQLVKSHPRAAAPLPPIIRVPLVSRTDSAPAPLTIHFCKQPVPCAMDVCQGSTTKELLSGCGKELAEAVWSNPRLLPFLHCLVSWARATGFLPNGQQSTTSNGIVCATELALMALRFVQGASDVITNPPTGIPSKESNTPSHVMGTAPHIASNWLQTLQTIQESFGEADAVWVGRAFFSLIHALAFDGKPGKVFLDNDASAVKLSQLAFRLFHGMAQECGLQNSLARAPEMGEQVLVQQALAALPPSLMTRGYSGGKPGSSPSQPMLYVEGSSMFLLAPHYPPPTISTPGGSVDPSVYVSPKHLLQFSIYGHRRRPQHASKQCYDVSLRFDEELPDASVSSSHDNSIFSKALAFKCVALYPSYYAHACHQLALARRAGGKRLGALRCQIKYGWSYLTNMPRLFVEEAGTATVLALQQALTKGYRTIKAFGLLGHPNHYDDEEEDEDGDGGESALWQDLASLKLLGAKRDHDEVGYSSALGDSRIRALDAIVEGNAAIMQKTAQDASQKAKKRSPSKKLTPMASSFEPGLPVNAISAEDLVKRLLDLGFVPEDTFAGQEEAPSSYALSLNLDDTSTNKTQSLTLVYSSQNINRTTTNDPKMEEDRDLEEGVLKLQKGFLRPIRWLLQDIKVGLGEDCNAGGGIGGDIRLVISSGKSFDPFFDQSPSPSKQDSVASTGGGAEGDEIAEFLQEDDIKEGADGELAMLLFKECPLVVTQGALGIKRDVVKAFPESVFVRHTRALRFRPGPKTCRAVVQNVPWLLNAVGREALETFLNVSQDGEGGCFASNAFTLNVLQVTEHFDLENPQFTPANIDSTLYFKTAVSKVEFEFSMGSVFGECRAFGWETVRDDVQRDHLIRGLWAMAWLGYSLMLPL